MRIAASLLTLLAASSAAAVSTSYWTHTTEADFASGKLENLVATNLGELKLSRAIEPVLANDPQVAMVHALAAADDGTLYAATGSTGLLLEIKGKTSSPIADFGDVSVTAVLVESDGSLLAATSGEKGKVYRVRKDEKPVEIFSHEGVQYIWSLLRDDSGTMYVATGPQGQLFAVAADGTSKVIMDTEQNNLLTLAGDGKGTLFIGTDPNGIVYRYNTKTSETYVVYDANEPEINALSLDEKGNLFIAASEVTEESAAATPAAAPDGGHPEGLGSVPRIKDEPPAQPKPADPPAVSPSEPPAIPKSDEPKHLSILADEMAEDLSPATSAPTAPPATETPLPEAANTGAGSAIYRVDPDGFVREIFRQPVTLYGMIESRGKLLAATGPAGVVYSIDPAAEETAVIARTDAKEVTAITAAKDGTVYLGTSTTGTVAKLSPGFATQGTFTSTVLDASQISRFGKIHLTGTLPEGGGLKISTRSGNVSAEADSGWSSWTEPVAATQYSPITSPAARFLQYRLSFSSTPETTPSVSEITIAYQQPNQTPVIKSLNAVPKPAETPEAPASTSVLTVVWEAEDANTDSLEHALAYRSNGNGPWILIKDKLTEATHDWDTRGVADGSYQLRVTSSDETANASGEGKTASRVSETLIVDNTPPQIGDLKTAVDGKTVSIDLRVADQSTTVAKVEYSVDSSTDWQTVLPLDKIPDSPDEAYRFSIPNVSGGTHQITIRAADARGNQAYQNINVIMESK